MRRSTTAPGSAQCLQPGGEIRRLADHRLFLGLADPDEVADHDQPARDTHTDPQRLLRDPEGPTSIHDGKTGPNSALSIVFVRRGIAELHEYTIAHIFDDETLKSSELSRQRSPMIRADHLA